ncbi:MAG TPA: RNA 2',3'-cyclic phosphodiesterase [Candidatus Paceibacterota bacterium]
MKPHRVFIAINLPDEAKEKLLAYKNKWAEVPAKWTTPENLHITLAFLGNTSDQELAEVCELMREVGERHKPFSVDITRITYGPDARRPRMIWALIEKSPELLALQQDVEKTLEQGSSQTFSPHLTLARLKAFELRRMEPEEIPEIDEEILISIPVQSIEVMESQLKRSGPQYTICQSVVL